MSNSPPEDPDSRPAPIPAYLGRSFDQLPAEIRQVHNHAGLLTISGRAEARIWGGALGALICRVVGLPRAGVDQPVTVSFEVLADGSDYWVRNFSGRSYRSRWYAGQGAFDGCLVEHLGLMQNGFVLTAAATVLTLELKKFAFCGIVLPRWLAPRCTAIETGGQGKFGFDIIIDLPVLGRLIAYKGTLRLPAPNEAP